jgi:hypothetical protein
VFRIIFAILFLILAGALYFGHPDSWHWPATLYCAGFIHFMADGRPLTVILLIFFAVALVMTRKVL